MIKPSEISMSCNEHSFDDFDFSECRFLYLLNFNPKSGSFEELPDMPMLSKLEIHLTNSRDFRGLDKFPFLTELTVTNCRRLSSYDGIEKLDCLKYLFIENARKLCGHENAAYPKCLETLALINCGAMQSIDFISSMDRLTDFRFYGTDCLDGKLLPLTVHEPPLEFTSFSNKRYYSHKLYQVYELIGRTDLIEYSDRIKNMKPQQR
ncbi:MAG: hypothetical protein IJ368_02670 [Oscillospiraceae bacterium]|nr:hypothetical protein [Oscillospiraceae bacterium]